ncbi:MAG: PilZ domain-containing protein [Alteraurantiacibacter sp.]
MAAPIPATIHRRRDSRLRIRLSIPAQVLTLDGQRSASLLDLSQSGAHLGVKSPMRRGQDVMLWWLGFEAFGRVVWASDNEVGVEFHEPLPMPLLLQTRQQIDAGVAPSTDMQAHEQARDWYMGHR